MKNWRRWSVFLLLLLALPAWSKVKLSKLAEKLLYGDEPTRLAGIEEFNRLSADEQQKYVPDFMVAMSDEDKQTRTIASRILKALGVKVEAELPDAKKEMKPEKATSPGSDQWAAEKKLKEEAGSDKWSDLKRMQNEERGDYNTMKSQLDNEKKAFLDLSQLTGSADNTSPLASVKEALNDSDPWVRVQAARRLGNIRPAPVEVIPDLIKMLGENNIELRRAAVAALGSFGPLAREAIPALNTALSDPDKGTRELAQEALKQVQMQP